MLTRLTLLAALGLSLHAAGAARSQDGRNLEREATEQGMNLFDYTNKLQAESKRQAYTYGPEGPGTGDNPDSWKHGYDAAINGTNPGNLNYSSPSYLNGYAAGQRQVARNADADAVRRKPLFERYGSKEAVDAWDRGFREGERGSNPNPPGVERPNAYIAYVDGHAAGKLSRVNGDGMNAASARKATGRDALRYAKEYVKHLNLVTQYSDQYYLLLDSLMKEFELPDDVELTVAASVERSKVALEAVKELIKLHGLINHHAYIASRVQPFLIAAMEAQASDRLALIKQMELESDRKTLFIKADELTAEAKRLGAEPVKLPGNFHEKGRHHRQLLQVLSLALESDQVREALGTGKLDTRGVQTGKFTAFARSWRDGQGREYEAWKTEFNEWLTTRLPRQYPSE